MKIYQEAIVSGAEDVLLLWDSELGQIENLKG